MNLDEIRQEITHRDQELIRLFLRRMELSQEVADYKQNHGLPILDKVRERQVLHNLCSQGPKEMESYIKMLTQTLFNLSKAHQSIVLNEDSDLEITIKRVLEETPKQFPRNAVVACQGTEGSYSQIAADRLFATSEQIMYFKGFENVFEAVEKGLCQYGVLPLENSSLGSVYSVYDLMRKHQFHIVRSLKMHIPHCLVAQKGVKQEEIKEIYSHPQALGQCSNFLERHKEIQTTFCQNTAFAAEKVAKSDRRDVAAIASPNCASLYGLDIIHSIVVNDNNNYTRFICISKDMEIYPGANKMSLILSVPHESGSLASILSRFQALGINLCKLESRPIPGTDFQFLFYFDIEASPYDHRILSILWALKQESAVFQFLGSYSEV